jgi:hypothetical protein
LRFSLLASRADERSGDRAPTSTTITASEATTGIFSQSEAAIFGALWGGPYRLAGAHFLG